MKTYNAKDIRNIAIAGHGGRGKTTLAEAFLYLSKGTDRLGRVLDSNTVTDFDAEEKKRKASVSTAVAPVEWKNKKINFLDTPGLFDFAGGMSEGIRAAECTLIVLAAGSSYDVGGSKAFKISEKRNIGRMFAVTRCDAENADFYKTFDSLKEEIDAACPVVVPHMEGDKVACYVDLVKNKAFAYNAGKASEVAMPADAKIDELRDVFNETLAGVDDDLMEKYFGGEEFTADEIAKGMQKGIAEGTIYPVYACAGYTTDAVDLLLDAIADYAPNAADNAGETALKGEEEVEIKCDENGPLAAICFKTIADPFVGKMSFFKVVSGKITPDAQAYNERTGEGERMGKIVTVKGGKQEDAAAIVAGDIGVVTKLASFKTGDTMCSAKNAVKLEKVNTPAPCYSQAVVVKKSGEEEKVAAGLTKLKEEDTTITFAIDKETKEQVLSGLGEQHLDVITSKLKAKFGVEVELKTPRVAYRETIRKKVEVQGRHKKQSGGHGQFGDVYIRFEPHDGNDLIFAEEIVGGSVPKQYFPAVEKGLRECVAKGIIAGYPMVGLKATLYFGSYHPVDSSEMAFKTAAGIAFKNGIPQAQPTILEPVGSLKAYVPDSKMGDIMGDITKRRGRVLGMGPAEDEPKMQLLEAEVPMAEMGDFAISLRSVTGGRGHFSLEFLRYEDAPANVAQKVIEEAKANAED